MKSNWKEERLGSLVRFSSGGTPNKNNPDYWNGTIPWISAKNMKSEVIETSDLSITEEGLIHGSKIAPKGSLLLLVRGSGLFNGIPVCYLENAVAYNQDVKCIESTSELENKYLFYWLKANSGYLRKKIEFTSIGAGKFDTRFLSNLVVRFPDKVTRKKIIDIADNISDRININKKINENLLQQASTIYKAWFDDFIPFDGICPAEWEQGVLSDIADITSGKRPPMKSAEKTSIATVPLVGAASVMGFTSEANHTDKILVTGRVGTHGVVQRFNTPCWTSDNTLVITSAFYEYTYQILQRIDYHAMNRGSTQPLITQGDMNKVVILIPDRQTLDDFEALVGLLMSQYEANLLENTKLAKLRDALLPKLMSGELDVSDLDI